jgi:molybdenum cofactor biosynthesis enzyme MoaA
MVKWLEITADYRCNNRCVGCFSVQDAGPEMATPEVIANLQVGRQEGARWLWLGGGEPTLRRDLLPVVAAARRMGYQRIKLQTNGMLLSYPDFTRRLAAAGVTEVNVSLKGATAESHDRLTRTPGCHALLVEGIAQARSAGLAIEGDILVYRSNAHELPEMIRVFTALGVQRYNLWLLSTVGAADASLAGEVPRIAEIMPHITAAMDLGLSPRPDFITSLHTPPCTVPASHHAALFHAPELGLLVTNPGGFRFMLEQSPIEGGVYFERCGGCAFRPRCGGARGDYVTIHGDSEFQPR